jgi:hypothetical protein
MPPTDNTFLDHPLQLLIALALTLILGWPIRMLLDAIARRVEIPRPRAIPAAKWDALIEIPGYLGGSWVGGLERFLFFASVAIGAPELAIAWLAFKVASKWEVWNNLYKMPDSLPRVSKVDYFLARTRWGARTLQRFLVGTAANLAAAIIGIAFFHAITGK